MKPLITVVIPTYQAEKTIVRCLESVINQTYKNLEILCGDDASTDETVHLIEKYSRNDYRIQLICFAENRGQAAVRNSLIKRATGTFLCFIDADDYVDNCFVEKLYCSMREYGSDISVCNYYIESLSGKREKIDQNYRGLMSSERFRREIFYDTCPSFLWNKLFRSALFHGNMLCEGIVWEDLEWMGRTAVRIQRGVSFVQDPLYIYVQNPNSTCHKRERMVYKSGCIAYAFYRRYCLALNMYDQDLIDIAMAQMVRRVLAYYTYKKYDDDGFILKYEEEMNRDFNSLTVIMIFKNKIMQLKEKVQYYFFRINKNLFFKNAKKRLGL